MKLSVVANEEVRKVLAEMIDSDIPVQTSWKLKKLILKFDEHFTTYQQCRNDLVKKYAVVDAEGKHIVNEKNEITVDPKNMDAFAKDMTDLVNIDVEMPSISIKEFGTTISFKAKKLFVLGDLIVD